MISAIPIAPAMQAANIAPAKVPTFQSKPKPIIQATSSAVLPTQTKPTSGKKIMSGVPLNPKTTQISRSLPNTTSNSAVTIPPVATLVKQFVCEYCSKSFVQNGTLIAHLRTHTAVPAVPTTSTKMPKESPPSSSKPSPMAFPLQHKHYVDGSLANVNSVFSSGNLHSDSQNELSNLVPSHPPSSALKELLPLRDGWVEIPDISGRAVYMHIMTGTSSFIRPGENCNEDNNENIPMPTVCDTNARCIDVTFFLFFFTDSFIPR